MDDLKQKISVLWIFFALMMTVHYVMYIFEPGALQQVNAGVIVLSPALAILELFVNWFIPLTMAFLTLSLKDDLNRRVNLIMGIIFTIYGVFHIMTCPLVHIINPAVHQLLICTSTIVITALISWFAYSWSQE